MTDITAYYVKLGYCTCRSSKSDLIGPFTSCWTPAGISASKHKRRSRSSSRPLKPCLGCIVVYILCTKLIIDFCRAQLPFPIALTHIVLRYACFGTHWPVAARRARFRPPALAPFAIDNADTHGLSTSLYWDGCLKNIQCKLI